LFMSLFVPTSLSSVFVLCFLLCFLCLFIGRLLFLRRRYFFRFGSMLLCLCCGSLCYWFYVYSVFWFLRL
jgi:uncharacterized membrane protein YhfC